MKFRENILDDIRVMERTLMMEALMTDKRKGAQNFRGYNLIHSPLSVAEHNKVLCFIHTTVFILTD